MKNKLTSIADHSDYLHSIPLISMSKRWELHRKRVEFGRQKLELWMFVPCKLVNGAWVVLEERTRPNKSDYFNDFGGNYDLYKYNLNEWKEYQAAKDRVLFEGFEYDKMGFAYLPNKSGCGFDKEYMENTTIEDLVKYDLTVTATAQKQLWT